MNKLVKGSIAGAAGIALLLGGAGTLALWNADAYIANTAIRTRPRFCMDTRRMCSIMTVSPNGHGLRQTCRARP